MTSRSEMPAPCEWCGAEAATGVCPKSLTCPDCKAKPGASCKRPSGHRCDTHASRYLLAESVDAPVVETNYGLQLVIGC
jgi:hypothetical protein